MKFFCLKVQLNYGVYENSIAINSEQLSPFLSSNGAFLNYFKKTVIDKLGEPYNKCEDNTDSLNSPLTKEIRSRGSEYKQRICFNLCRHYFIQDSCNCSLQYQLWANGSDSCERKCVEKIVDKFDYEENCKSCPLECDSVLY